jgi:hypothetical protein
MRYRTLIGTLLVTGLCAVGQDMPADYTGVLKSLAKQGDFKDVNPQTTGQKRRRPVLSRR